MWSDSLVRGARRLGAGRSGILIAVAIVAVPATAAAQAGWYVTPAIRVSESFDDNVPGAPKDRRVDFVTRTNGGATAGYRSTPLVFLIGSDLGFEYYVNNPEFEKLASAHAAVDFQYNFERRLTLRLGGSFDLTETPQELNPDLAIEQGRGTTTSLSVTAALDYRFARGLDGSMSYSVTRVEGFNIVTVAQEASLRISGAPTKVDTLTAAYSLRYTDGDGQVSTSPGQVSTSAGQVSTRDGQVSTSHAITGAWTRRLSQTWTASLEAGPRLSDDGLDVEARASLSHRLRNGDWIIAYTRTQRAFAGQQGLADTQSLTTTTTFRPQRSLLLALTSTTTEATLGTIKTRGTAVEASATYRLTRYINAVARYRFSLQRATRQQDVTRDIISIELEASYPIRLH